MAHLQDASPATLRRLVSDLAPALRDATIDPLPVMAVQPRWCRGACLVGATHVLKVCWSTEAEAPLRLQSQLLPILSGFDPDLPTPVPVAASDDPVALLYERLPGVPLTYDEAGRLDKTRQAALAHQIAGALGALHSDALRAACDRSGVRFGRPQPQASTRELRNRLAPRLDSVTSAWLFTTLAWVDRALASPSADVVLHGDFHGYNLVIDDQVQLVGVLDFEETGLGPVEFDFRYLPRQSPHLGLLDDVMHAYEARSGRALDIEAIFAWHVLTDLGDALWRTEAGVEVVAGPIEKRIADLRILLAQRGICHLRVPEPRSAPTGDDDPVALPRHDEVPTGRSSMRA